MVKVIDRGIDEVLILDDGKIHEISKYQGFRMIRFLVENGLLDAELITYDEYEKSDKYNNSLLK